MSADEQASMDRQNQMRDAMGGGVDENDADDPDEVLKMICGVGGMKYREMNDAVSSTKQHTMTSHFPPSPHLPYPNRRERSSRRATTTTTITSPSLQRPQAHQALALHSRRYLYRQGQAARCAPSCVRCVP